MNKEQLFETTKYKCQRCHKVYLTMSEYFHQDGLCDSCYHKYLDEQIKEKIKQ